MKRIFAPEDRLHKIFMMDIVREKLSLQAEGSARHIVDAGFAVCNIRKIRSIKLNARLSREHFHGTPALRIAGLRHRQKSSVSAIAVDHKVVVVAARQDQLRIIISNLRSDGFRRAEVKRSSVHRQDLSRRDLARSERRRLPWSQKNTALPVGI